MRAVIQRVSQAQVSVEDRIVGAIGFGMMVLLGVDRQDSQKDLDWMVDKIVHLRIFEDKARLMNQSLLDVGGQLLVFEGLDGGVRHRGVKSQSAVSNDHGATREHHRLDVGVTGGNWVQQHGTRDLGAFQACGGGRW